MGDLIELPETSDGGVLSENLGKLIDVTVKEAEADPSVLFRSEVIDAFREWREIDALGYFAWEEGQKLKKAIPYRTIQRLTKLSKPAKKSDQGGLDGKSDLLVRLIRDNSDLFCDEDEEAYVTVKGIENQLGDGTHSQTFLLRSWDFRRWASKAFFKQYQTTPSDSGFKDAIETLEGFADDGEVHSVYLRYAWVNRSVYVALHDADCRVVHITADGWFLMGSDEAPVRFRRSRNTRPLPEPLDDGEITDLWDHVNQADSDTRLLVEAWLLEAMRSEFPFPVLEVSGEQGSAKSTFQRRLCDLIHPSKVTLRSPPKSTEDFFVAAKHSPLLCYDNMSSLSASEQDALCTMSTGGGFATRRLHTTNEEEMWDTKCPVILGGISELATQADLADRVVAVELPRVGAYVQQDDLESSWNEAYPKILGGLYQAMADALACLQSVSLDKPPRMADFAYLGEAMLCSRGEQGFSEIFMRNRDRVVTRAIESSPVAASLLRMTEDFNNWSGTTSALLSLLNDKYQPKYYEKGSFPRSARGLGALLRRLAPALRVRGIEIEHKRTNKGWEVRVSKHE